MAKSAGESATKYVNRAGMASGDYVSGAESTTKDQAQAAINGKANWQAGITAAIQGGRYEKGLSASGKTGWLEGVRRKGANRYADGVSNGAAKYATNSGKYDSARKAADSMPRGPKGSPQNFQRSQAVGTALRSLKVGK